MPRQVVRNAESLSAGKRRPILHYIALAILFVLAGTYQVRYTEYRCPTWFGRGDAVYPPFFLSGFDGNLRRRPNVIVQVFPPVPGLRAGDILVAVNGRPLHGLVVLSEELAKPHPAGELTVTVRNREETPTEQVVVVPLAQRRPSSLLWIVPLVVLPAFSFVLGFWVAAIRPRDPRAWLVLGLMLCAAVFFDPGAELWARKLRDVILAYRIGLLYAFPIFCVLFGLYFPEPLPNKHWGPRWRWLTRCFVIFLAAFAVLHIVAAVAVLENQSALQFLHGLPREIDGFGAWIGEIAVGASVITLGVKSRLAVSSDSKRRLRLLYTGAAISLLPRFALEVIANIKHVPLERYFPAWLYAPAYAMLFLFPITLAYVIVVQRAMDVRLVIRQGLQYALAKNGIRALQIGTLGLVLLAAMPLFTNGQINRPKRIAVVGAGLVLLFLTRRTADDLGTWTDRHFFRDTYDAEQILSELSEQVRTMVETRPLLQNVSQRVADSLHIPRVAVLLESGGSYRLAYAVGYNPVPAELSFPANGATIEQLKKEMQPTHVYFEDPNSWIYAGSGMGENERANLVQLETELLLPVAVKDKLLGFMSLASKLSEQPYTRSDLRLLKSVASQTGVALEVARLTTAIGEETAQRERLNRELEIAREVQQRLFPQKLINLEGIDYSGLCRPAREVGGDYYDFVVLPEGKLGIAIGDVSGKGIGAALMMAGLAASLRGQAALAAGKLAALTTRLSRNVFETSPAHTYATFFYAQYDPENFGLTYVNAGHNPPMILRNSEGGWELIRLETGGPPLGLFHDSEYQEGSLTLRAGDLAIAFTDGVSEAMNSRDEEWGEGKLLEAARNCNGLSAAETISRVFAAADAFARGAPQHDDMTLVVLCVRSAID